MRMINRQALIYEYIKKHQEVSINHIAEYFCISPVTVRRYADKLEQNGLIYREYGKAIIADRSKEEMPFLSRLKENIEFKRKIAQLALPYLLNASSVFFDASSTALELLKLLPKSKSITIYTANSAVFHDLQDYDHVRLFVLGGYLSKADGLTLDSDVTINIAKDIFVDAVFFSCAGFTEEGIFNNATTGIGVKQIMLGNSSHNYLLADHTKFNAKGVLQMATWDSIQTLICDTSFDPKTENLLRKKGVDVVF